MDPAERKLIDSLQEAIRHARHLGMDRAVAYLKAATWLIANDISPERVEKLVAKELEIASR